MRDVPLGCLASRATSQPLAELTQAARGDTGQSGGRWPAPPQDPRQTAEGGRQLGHLDLMLPPNQDRPFLPSPKCLYPLVPIHLLSSLPLFPPPPPLDFPLSSVPSRLPLLSLCDSLSQMTSPATDFSVSDLASGHAVQEAPAGRTRTLNFAMVTGLPGDWLLWLSQPVMPGHQGHVVEIRRAPWE